MRDFLNILGLSALLLVATVAATSSEAPDETMIDAAQKKKAGVMFPHKVHIETVESCDTCHHTQEGLTADAGVEVESCTSCHLDPEKPETPSMREMSLKKNPLHSGCIDCHKAEDKGPTKCDDCHPKE